MTPTYEQYPASASFDARAVLNAIIEDAHIHAPRLICASVPIKHGYLAALRMPPARYARRYLVAAITDLRHSAVATVYMLDLAEHVPSRIMPLGHLLVAVLPPGTDVTRTVTRRQLQAAMLDLHQTLLAREPDLEVAPRGVRRVLVP